MTATSKIKAVASALDKSESDIQEIVDFALGKGVAIRIGGMYFGTPAKPKPKPTVATVKGITVEQNLEYFQVATTPLNNKKSKVTNMAKKDFESLLNRMFDFYPINKDTADRLVESLKNLGYANAQIEYNPEQGIVVKDLGKFEYNC